MAEVDYEDIELHERLRAARAVIAQQKAEIERLRAAGERLNVALLVTSTVWGRQHQSDDDAKYHRMVNVALDGWGGGPSWLRE